MSVKIESLSPDAFAELTRAVRRQGGHRALVECVAHAIDYGNEQAQPGAARTCGCGRPRLLQLDYEYSDGITKQYRACADCDAVHLQPRYLEV